LKNNNIINISIINNKNMNYYIYLLLIIFLGLQYINELKAYHQFPLSDIETKIKLDNNYFKSIHIYSNEKTAYFYKNTTLPNEEEQIYKIKYEDYTYFVERINKLYIDKTIPIFFRNDINIIDVLFNTILKIGLIFMITSTLYNIFLGSKTNMFSAMFGKVSYKVNTNDTTSFNDVIGLKSVKKELTEYTNFMKHRDVYLKYGYNIPRGLLFVGPPGTGKTHLAKAFAKESNARFLSVCGSDFIEIFVGTGSKRVRELFEKAKEGNKPSVIFIDEIDAIGGKRLYGSNGGTTEHNSTLNSLLVEMDGFSSIDNIIIIASTNMPEILDPALTRSGRFDKQIVFDAPNIDERKEMFKLYLNKVQQSKEFKDDLDNYINKLSKQTAGMTGADIKNIVNQSVYNFLEKHDDKINIDNDFGITYNDIHKSIDDVMIGMEKPERKMSTEEIKRVAYHEAGHTLISYLLSTTTPPIKTSIIPRGIGALGYTQQEPHDKKLHTIDDIIANICVLFGGRASEEIFLGSVSTGASDDLKKIDKLIETLISNCRFEELGYVDVLKDDKWDNQFVKNILTELYKQTSKMIINNKSSIIKLSNYLIKYEIILADDIKTLLGKKLRKSIKSNSLLNL
jgi:ATP-dependent metalloprotease FtsH